MKIQLVNKIRGHKKFIFWVCAISNSREWSQSKQFGKLRAGSIIFYSEKNSFVVKVVHQFNYLFNFSCAFWLIVKSKPVEHCERLIKSKTKVLSFFRRMCDFYGNFLSDSSQKNVPSKNIFSTKIEF